MKRAEADHRILPPARGPDAEPETELTLRKRYTLLVAVVHSAQATDASVNLATRATCSGPSPPRRRCFDSGEERLREAIKTIGLFNTKAKERDPA
jgi:endonuclease-3